MGDSMRLVATLLDEVQRSISITPQMMPSWLGMASEMLRRWGKCRETAVFKEATH